MVRLSASDFTVGYHWDPVRQVKTIYIKIDIIIIVIDTIVIIIIIVMTRCQTLDLPQSPFQEVPSSTLAALIIFRCHDDL